jgi:hypothetical protein
VNRVCTVGSTGHLVIPLGIRMFRPRTNLRLASSVVKWPGPPMAAPGPPGTLTL